MPAKNQQKTVLRRVSENLYRNDSSGTYYGWVKRGGKQIKRSLETTDLAQAKSALRDFIGDLEGKDATNLTRGILFEPLAKEWLDAQYHLKTSSKNRTEYGLNQILKVFGSKELRKITASDLRKWAAKRAKERKASTFNKELSTVKAVFELGVEKGYILKNPAEGLKRAKINETEKAIPSRDEFNSIINTLRVFPDRYHEAANLVELLGLSGMRLGEATALRWDQIHDNLVYITGGEEGTKSRKNRTIPLFPSLKEYFDRIQPENASGRVIHIDSAKKALITVCKHLKMQNYTHHSMRHYFCSNCIEKGIDFKTIAAWLGHADGGVLVAKTYGHLRLDHSFSMAQRM